MPRIKNALAWSTGRLETLRASTEGQNLVEYALLTGFVAVTGGLVLLSNPAVNTSMKQVVLKVSTYLALAAAAGQSNACV